MITKTTSRKRQTSFGAGIVRGWFDAVLNPLIQALKYQQTRLERQNWTWLVPPGKLESILPVKNLIAPLAEDTLEQFLDFHPNLKKEIELYENKRATLEEACQKLQHALTQSEEFANVYQQARHDNSTYTLDRTISSVFSEHMSDSEHLEILAQYAVNNIEELFSHYVYAPVWNKYRDEFLALLEIPQIKPKARKVVQAGQALLAQQTKLPNLLRETRNELSLEYDVPFVSMQANFH